MSELQGVANYDQRRIKMLKAIKELGLVEYEDIARYVGASVTRVKEDIEECSSHDELKIEYRKARSKKAMEYAQELFR